jgi:hypothetical protein
MVNMASKKVVELSDAIKAKHGTEAAGARSVGWRRQRLHKLLTLAVCPTVEDANTLAKMSGMSVTRVCAIFLRYASPNEQRENKGNDVN